MMFELSSETVTSELCFWGLLFYNVKSFWRLYYRDVIFVKSCCANYHFSVKNGTNAEIYSIRWNLATSVCHRFRVSDEHVQNKFCMYHITSDEVIRAQVPKTENQLTESRWREIWMIIWTTTMCHHSENFSRPTSDSDYLRECFTAPSYYRPEDCDYIPLPQEISSLYHVNCLMNRLQESNYPLVDSHKYYRKF